MQINPELPLGHHWVLASANVVPTACQCTCGSSGLLVCSNYVNYDLWIAAGKPLGDSFRQCGSSVVCPVVSKCNDRIWFGGHSVRPLPNMQPLMYTTSIARVVWVKLISFELQPQIHKNYNGAHTQSMHCVMLTNSPVLGAGWYPLQGSKLQVKSEFTETCRFAVRCPIILSFQTGMAATLLIYMCLCVWRLLQSLQWCSSVGCNRVSPVAFHCEAY